MTSSEFGGGRPPEAYGDAAPVFRADVRVTQDRSGMVMGVPTGAVPASESLAVFTPQAPDSGALVNPILAVTPDGVGDHAEKPELPVEPGEHAQEHHFRGKYGKSFTYLDEPVDTETPWRGWERAVNENKITRTTTAAVRANGRLTWTRNETIKHDELKETFEDVDEPYVRVYTKYDHEADAPGIHVYSNGYKTPEGEPSLVDRTVAYFARSLSPDSRSRAKLHVADELPSGDSHQYKGSFDNYITKVAQGELPGVIYHRNS